MSYHVVVMPTATRNLRQILGWVAERSPQGASRLLNAFEDRLDDLSTRPESFGLAPESYLVNQEIREFHFKTPRGRRYRGLFRVAGQSVEVLHIRGPGQDFVPADQLN